MDTIKQEGLFTDLMKDRAPKAKPLHIRLFSDEATPPAPASTNDIPLGAVYSNKITHAKISDDLVILTS